MRANARDLPRIARVYLASTFRDLGAERSILLRRAALDLREFAREHGIEFAGFLDLRWGILAEQIQAGRLLDLCLRNVDLCSPFFLGIIGRHRGTEADPREHGRLIRSDLGWSKTDLRPTRGFSITELEFWHALKIRPAEIRRVSFFTRAAATDSPAAPFRPAVQQLLAGGPRTPIGFSSPEDLCAKVTATLKQQLLDELGTARAALDPLALAAAGHNHFAALRLQHYQPDTAAWQKVAGAFDHQPGRYVVVGGSAGAGKSAFMAYLANTLPEPGGQRPTFLHFCSLDAAASSLDNLLTRLITEIHDYLRAPAPVSRLNLEEKVRCLPQLLAQAGRRALAQRTQATFLIDGLDQLEATVEGSVNSRNWSSWLPSVPPRGVFMVLAKRTREELRVGTPEPGFAAGTLKHTPPIEVEISPLDRERRCAMLKSSVHPKHLNRASLARLSVSPLAHSPLFVKAVSGELAAETDYRAIPRLAVRLGAMPSIAELYGVSLDRMQAEHARWMGENAGGSLFRLLALLLCSRTGLGGSELSVLTSSGAAGDPTGWTLASMILRDHLVHRGGRCFFAHEEFREAVREKIAGTGLIHRANRDLADHFYRRWRAGDEETRTIDRELPWHLERAGQTHRLLDYLANLPTLLRRGESPELFWESCALYRQALAPAHRRWKSFHRRVQRQLAKPALPADAMGQALIHLGRLLNVINLNRQALQILEDACRLSPNAGPAWRQARLGAGDAARELSEYALAQRCYRDAARAAGPAPSPAIRSLAVFGLARIERLRGQYGRALRHYLQALQATEALPDRSLDKAQQLPWRHFGLGEIYRLVGDRSKARFHYQAAWELFDGVHDPRGRAYAAWGQGEIARLDGQLALADERYGFSLRLCEECHDQRSWCWAVLGLAEVRRARFHEGSSRHELREALDLGLSIGHQAESPPTERHHAKLLRAECYRLETVLTITQFGKAARLYRQALRYYESKRMGHCARLAREGLRLLPQSRQPGAKVSDLDLHPLRLP